MACTYDALKDFAGPIATVIAATAALIVTVYFNRRQAKTAMAQKDIAAAQKNIAADKLKHDLFDKRYEIYDAAKSLIKCSSRYSYEKLPSERIVEIKIKLDEARFFFPKDIQALALEIEQACEAVMSQIDRRRYQTPEDDAEWAASGDRLAESEAKLRHLYAELPARFERDLRFDQITRDPSG
jgi:hypothetical protein